MAKLQWMKWYPDDWVMGTRSLSIEAKGCWIEILMLMWNAPNRGVWTGTYEEFARVTGSPWEDAPRLVEELTKVANLTKSNNILTLKNRRMIKEQKEHEYNAKRQRHYYHNAKPNKNLTDKTPLDSSRLLKTSQDLKTTSMAATAAKPYELPDPKVNPTACLVISYKTRKGVAHDSRVWDEVNWARAAKAAKALIALCGDIATAEACLTDLSEGFNSGGMTWTLETIAKHASDWMQKKGKTNAHASRDRLHVAIAQRKSEGNRQSGLVKVSERAILGPLRDCAPPQDRAEEKGDGKPGGLNG